jgi:hypothetical protein
VQPKGLGQLKNSVNSSGIETVIFRFNQLRYSVTLIIIIIVVVVVVIITTTTTIWPKVP